MSELDKLLLKGVHYDQSLIVFEPPQQKEMAATATIGGQSKLQLGRISADRELDLTSLKSFTDGLRLQTFFLEPLPFLKLSQLSCRCLVA